MARPACSSFCISQRRKTMSGNLIEKTPSAYDYPLLIKHLLTSALVNRPDREIVNADGSRYTLSSLVERIGRLAGGLASLGVGPGDTVGVMNWDTPRYLEAYFAVPMMGAVLHTLNVRLSPEQFLYTIEHAEDKVILVNKDFLPLLEAIKGRISTVEKYVLIADGSERPPTSIPIAAEYEELLETSSPGYTFPDFDENTRATTFYTTGTTGLPKGVYFSHRQIMLHTLGALVALSNPGSHQRFHRDDVYMPLTPMFHVHAWGIPYMATLMGVKQVYPGKYVPDTILRLIQEEGVTFSHCVPTVLHMVLSCPASAGVDLSNWKVIVGGSALPKGLAKAALDRGIDIFAGYGMSETGPILTLAQLTPEMLERSPGEQIEVRTRTGQAIPLVDLRIVDEEMRDLPHDGKATGEVVLRAPWLTQGYYKDSATSEHLWRGGYLHTGDIGYIDPQGFLQITDRIKDVIKTGGEWISSLEIEDMISQHPAVSEVAVIGLPDEKWGERAVALIVLKPGQASEVTPDEIKSHVRGFAEKGIISQWAVPDRVQFVDAIEKTSVGKIDKKLLRARYQ
jgi:fatty-acyl-CoA synthase